MKSLIKIEKSEDWAKAKNFIPKAGEIIAYKDDEVKFKIGDGITHVNDLPFTDEKISFHTLDGNDFIIRD